MTRSRIALFVGTIALAIAATGLRTTAGPDVAPFVGAVNVYPASPKVGSCIPFANNRDFGFSGFIYRNIPAFTLQPGTQIGFDLGDLNDVDVRRDIYFSVADHNPGPGAGNVRALKWVKIVSETQLPSSPRGNAVIGDFELRYRSEAAFTFAGGGLIIGFGGSPPGFYPDMGCEQVGVTGTSSDPSARFYGRFWGRPDRDLTILDRGNFGTTFLSGFVVFTDTTPPVVTGTVTPAPGPDGWVAPGSATVTFSGTDDGSGVASCDPSVEITEPGVHQVTGTCVDNANNVGSTTVTVMLARGVTVDVLKNDQDPLNVHRKGPASFTVLAAGGFDPHRIDVTTIRFGATGSEASVESCEPVAADLTCRFDVGVADVAPSLVMTATADGIKVVGSGTVNVLGSVHEPPGHEPPALGRGPKAQT